MNQPLWSDIEYDVLPELAEVGRFGTRDAAYPMPMETHPDAVEFLLLHSGRKQIRVEDRPYELSGGEMLVIFPGERHGAEDAVQNRMSLTYFLMRVPTGLPRFCMLEEDECGALWRDMQVLRGRRLRVSPAAARSMERIYTLSRSDSGLRQARLRTELMSFLFLILEESGAEEPVLPPDIAAVIRYIRESRDEMPDIARMAALVNLSESRFKQKFKQATGIPPAEFTVREKIREAEELLTDPSRTVTSIAMELGFGSSQHFSTLFRKYTGLSPVQYRKGT